MASGRLSNLNDYKGVLPYSSELFGVYQPIIGWRARRAVMWLTANAEPVGLVERLATAFDSQTRTTVTEKDCSVHSSTFVAASFAGPKLTTHSSVLLTTIAETLVKQGYEFELPNDRVWNNLTQEVDKILQTHVLDVYNERSRAFCASREALAARREGSNERIRRDHSLAIQGAIAQESKAGGVVLQLAKAGRYDLLERIFYKIPKYAGDYQFKGMLGYFNYSDPLENFDPRGDLSAVTVSPIGVTHLFRQFFFELDTFLGTPVAHLYVPPGSTSEIIEVSTRRSYVEKTIEQSTEMVRKEETSNTEEDEISEAIRDENRSDTKLGVSSTVEQSWGTGNISATASISMDRSQIQAREQTHKRMRQQSSKVSSEIRQNFKTTFKTISEATDMVSKRYVIGNPTNEMVNYELRRKMRQVAVQVQDVGTYLCWDTFVDEPGTELGIANLVHMARPADLLPRPPDLIMAALAPVQVPFTANGVWDYDDRQGDQGNQFVRIGSVPVPPGPPGYDLMVTEPAKPEEPQIWLSQISASGDDFHQVWAYGGKFNNANIDIGVWTKSTGIGWNERVDFVLQGSVTYVPGAGKRAEIETAQKLRTSEQDAVDRENDRLSREALANGARERIEQAASIIKRKYEDLRDEERIVVYRRLIKSLMTRQIYEDVEIKEGETDRNRHVLSQLINTIFDVDKMLYFVAPEWWKPRNHARLGFGPDEMQVLTPEAMVTWTDGTPRTGNYLITDDSLPAAKGSSLGWLLQLDGDDMRNAFLNAPWVKAVMPVRPGREQAAINWLKNAGVEGSEGLGDLYAAADDELSAIKTKLGLPDNHAVKLEEAIEYLCLLVAEKHDEGVKTKQYPDSEIDDSSTVHATPIEKVYEHGFYPLQGGFRINPSDPGDDPNNQEKNFQVFDQWVEILPTDQIVPVAVSYNPITGRQIPPEV